MPTATPETIRNRVAALIEALTPTSDSGTRFRQSRDEAAADFPTWAESAPTACLRRFQVRNPGSRGVTDASNVDVSRHELELRIRVAYPNTHRFGGGRDRDDVIDEDFRKLDYAIGIYGRANFSLTNDCTPLGLIREDDERGEKVTFLVLLFRCIYTLDVDG